LYKQKPAISLLAYAEQLTYVNNDIADFYCSWAGTALKDVKDLHLSVFRSQFLEIWSCKT